MLRSLVLAAIVAGCSLVGAASASAGDVCVGGVCGAVAAADGAPVTVQPAPAPWHRGWHGRHRLHLFGGWRLFGHSRVVWTAPAPAVIVEPVPVAPPVIVEPVPVVPGAVIVPAPGMRRIHIGGHERERVRVEPVPSPRPGPAPAPKSPAIPPPPPKAP